MERLHHHQAERGEHTAHVQLRYFLQLMTEASCVEWALVIAVALRDALAVLRTCNAARAPDLTLPALRRLRRALRDISAWTECECLGYKPFMLAISNQIPFLTSIINVRERRQSMVTKTRFRTSSTGSLTEPKTKPQVSSLETKLPPPQKAQEVSKQSVRKDSPTVKEPVVNTTSAPNLPSVTNEDTSGCAIM